MEKRKNSIPASSSSTSERKNSISSLSNAGATSEELHHHRYQSASASSSSTRFGNEGASSGLGGGGIGARRSSSSVTRHLQLEQLFHFEPTSQDSNNEAYDMNGTHFNADMFIQRITREYSIDHLMKTERNLILQIQHLDSDMQTLVYENYNKFILATDTIRKMKTDFKEMEDKMALLSNNIVKITENSTMISESLREKRDRVARLSSIHELLKKLKFLFELPNKLKQFCEDGNYEEAVRCYLSGVQFVNEFKRFPSLEAIKQDCQHIVVRIRNDLYKDFDDEDKSSQDLTRNVTLLLNLGENSTELGNKFLDNALPKLAQNLDSLKTASSPNVSLEELMELGCGIFLSNLSLVIASYSQVFIKATDLNESLRLGSQEMLKPFVQNLMDKFLKLMEDRLTYEIMESNQQEAEVRENLLKAMDRLYRRLMAMGTLMPNTDFTQCGLDLITGLAKLDSSLCLTKIQSSFEKAVGDSGSELKNHPGSAQEVLGSILSTFIVQLKSSLSKLQDYCRSEFHFAQNAEFRQRVGISIAREGLVIASFKYLIHFGNQLSEEGRYDHLVWLLLSKLYLDIEAGPVDYMINIVEAGFDIKRKNPQWEVTNASDIIAGINATSKRLVREFVSFQGNQIAVLMKEAVIDKDLVSLSEEPTGPHLEMRKVVDILTKLEKSVEPIYPDPDSSSYMKSERSSDSSKRSYSVLPGGRNKAAINSSSWTNLDPNMTSNINKLFSEKVEIFGEVECHKSVILMSIVKIGVRALLEYVRIQTMGKFGLHQIQVDVHYLQLYLWRFVNESFLHTLLDEILTSSIQRCTNPVLLESTIVQIIAEKSN